MRKIEDRNGVKGVFPQAVPTDAKAVSFRYNSAFLQGGEVFKLSYTVTEGKMSQLFSWYNCGMLWGTNTGDCCTVFKSVFYRIDYVLLSLKRDEGLVFDRTIQMIFMMC